MYSLIVLTALGALPGASKTAPAPKFTPAPIAQTAPQAYQTAPQAYQYAPTSYYGPNPYAGNTYCSPFQGGPYCPSDDVNLFLPCAPAAPCAPYAPNPVRPVGAPRVNTHHCPTPVRHCPPPPHPGYAPCP